MNTTPVALVVNVANVLPKPMNDSPVVLYIRECVPSPATTITPSEGAQAIWLQPVVMGEV